MDAFCGEFLVIADFAYLAFVFGEMELYLLFFVHSGTVASTLYLVILVELVIRLLLTSITPWLIRSANYRRVRSSSIFTVCVRDSVLSSLKCSNFLR